MISDDNSIKLFKKNYSTVKIHLVEIINYLKFFQLFNLLSKLCDNSVMLAEPLLLLNMIDILRLHLFHRHPLL